MRRQRHYPVSASTLVAEMTVGSTVTLNDVETIDELSHIVGIVVAKLEQEFLKLSVFFAFESWGIEAHFVAIFQ